MGLWCLNFDLCPPNSCQKMEMLLQKIMAIHQHYRKDRLTGSMYVSLWHNTVFISLLLYMVNLTKLFSSFHHRVGV